MITPSIHLILTCLYSNAFMSLLWYFPEASEFVSTKAYKCLFNIIYVSGIIYYFAETLITPISILVWYTGYKLSNTIFPCITSNLLVVSVFASIRLSVILGIFISVCIHDHIAEFAIRNFSEMISCHILFMIDNKTALRIAIESKCHEIIKKITLSGYSDVQLMYEASDSIKSVIFNNALVDKKLRLMEILSGKIITKPTRERSFRHDLEFLYYNDA